MISPGHTMAILGVDPSALKTWRVSTLLSLFPLHIRTNISGRFLCIRKFPELLSDNNCCISFGVQHNHLNKRPFCHPHMGSILLCYWVCPNAWPWGGLLLGLLHRSNSLLCIHDSWLYRHSSLILNQFFLHLLTQYWPIIDQLIRAYIYIYTYEK